ncbi:MAG: LacI family DNA-binding transcriptional regulator, partial [Geminicoccaceae bacterium]
VSTVTVSRVANVPALVRPATRARVETAMRRLGYAPNLAAQSMRTLVTRTIGFLVPDLTNYPNAAVAKAAEATLAEAGYYMLLTDSDYDPAREARALQLLQSRQVDGIILYLSDEDDPVLQAAIRNLDVPVVVLDRDLPFAVDTVFSDHAEATRRTVQALVRHGHRRLALVEPELRIRPVRERVQAFRAAARAARLPPDGQVVILADPAARDLEAIEQALTGGRLPTAILVDGNRLLAGAFEIVRRRGLRVPADAAIVALDAVEPLAAAVPEMVGIVRDFAEIGQQAGRLMIDRLSGARTGAPVSITLASRSVLADRPRAPAAAPADR